MAAFFMSQWNLEYRKCITLFDILSSRNDIADTNRKLKTAIKQKGGHLMKTTMNILKLVGKAAANVIIWVAGKLERRE